MNEYKLKQELCEIGRRAFMPKVLPRQTTANISYRLNDKEILCTPTMVSKGFLKCEDLCKVDIRGCKQLAGTRKRSSEILLHLAVYKTAARRAGGRPLPSAACHRVRRAGEPDSKMCAARG